MNVKVGLVSLILLVSTPMACSSSGGAASSSTSAPPATISATPTESTSTLAAPTSSGPPPLSSTDLDAKDWLNFNRIAVELLLARKFAAERAIKTGRAAPGPCNDLVNAAFNLDDRLPHFGTALNKHPLIQALIDASSKYTIAGNACTLYVSGAVRRDFEKGDAFVREAQRQAKRLHERL